MLKECIHHPTSKGGRNAWLIEVGDSDVVLPEDSDRI